MACSGVSPSEWQPGRSGYSIKNPPPSSDDSGRIVNGYLSILANSFMLGIRSDVRRLPSPPYASCGHSSAFPQGFSWRWTRFYGTEYGTSGQYRRLTGPRRFSANSTLALGSTGCRPWSGFSRNLRSTNLRIHLAVTWPAHVASAGPLEHAKSRTRGSGADEGVRPTVGQTVNLRFRTPGRRGR